MWTEPRAAGRAADPSFAYRYADLTTLAPTSDRLHDGLARGLPRDDPLRSAHPSAVEQAAGHACSDGVTVLADNTCTRCHANRDAARRLQVPAGQLDLTDGASTDEATQFKAYRELLATDNEQELVRRAAGPPDAGASTR